MLSRFLDLSLYDDSARIVGSRILCGVAMEHAESTIILINTGHFTSATGLLRLQYEALVRAMWLLYAASDEVAKKVAKGLSLDSVKKSERIPMLSEMLSKLEGKAPSEAVGMLLEFKEYSWKPLSSYVHGGAHAIDRHSNGYPSSLLEQVLKASNAVSTMVAMLLVILSGDLEQRGKITKLQMDFSDCLPELEYGS
jgi:hypothetical protein